MSVIIYRWLSKILLSLKFHAFRRRILLETQVPSRLKIIYRSGHHPALSGIVTVNDVKKSRHHLKMLVGDLFTYEKKSEQSGGSPYCRLCDENKNETVSHILTFCSAYSDTRLRILEELANLCKLSISNVDFSDILKSSDNLCQFILDPTSMNLSRRVNMNDPLLGTFFKISRDICSSISEQRLNRD